MCKQNKIENGRRWVCIRDEHPSEPTRHAYAAPWFAQVAEQAKARQQQR